MSHPQVDIPDVTRLWFQQQGLTRPRGDTRMSKARLTEHLERAGGLQIDTINVVDRAPYLTLWSRFGPYDRAKIDRWLYRDKLAYEYWGHEASILPISHLPFGLRRMAGFPPASWKARSWWKVYQTSAASKRRVLRRLRDEGPLESGDFEDLGDDPSARHRTDSTMPLTKEDTRSLKLLWHAGKVAVSCRRHFRIVYDLAERVYPKVTAAERAQYEDSWLLQGLRGNGIASERHLVNYITGPALKAAERKRVIARNKKQGRIVEVRVKGVREPHFALPEHLDTVSRASTPEGTTLLCPFDSFLWQRSRAEDLLGFRYRIEIYVPPAKREFGYYVMPILHNGRLVGRLDPKVHRDRAELEIKSIHLESGFKRNAAFNRSLADALRDLGQFVGADALKLPRGWSNIA